MRGLSNLDAFYCPSCSSPTLEWREQRTTSESSTQYRCSSCGATFPIVNGIPRFVSADNYAQSFGFQWTTHRKTQLDSFTGMRISHDRLFGTTGWPEKMPGQRILEAGSGAGRFTECLVKTGAEVFSFDFSQAVEANFANNGGAENLRLFQGDMLRIPLPKGSFDKVLCIGVLQHTPDPERYFQALAEMVRPGGQLVIDLYRKDLPAMLQWKYILRPITKRMEQRKLYRLISSVVPPLIPVTRGLRKLAGRAGARLSPIVEFSHLGLSAELNEQWAILDTFDMYSPAFDLPQTASTVEGWFRRAGFEDFEVRRGPNGLVGRGRKEAGSQPAAGTELAEKACAASLA